MNDLGQRLLLALFATLSFAGCAAAASQTSAISAPVAAAQPAEHAPYLALYRRGPTYNAGRSLFEQQSIREHVAYHEALGQRLIAAGPLRGAPGGIVGAIVIHARDPAEAEAWLRADPAVVSGVLTATIAPWSASEIKAYRRTRER